MKRVIFNQKGGVGKTSITCNLGYALATAGKKVLIVDLDPQANSSQYILGDAYNALDGTISDFFAEILRLKIFSSNLARVVHKSAFPKLSIIPADKNLVELQRKLETRYKVLKLKQALDEYIDNFGIEEVLIDTSPYMNFYTMSALIAADLVLIPSDCDVFSSTAVHQVADFVEEIREDHNPDLRIEGVIVSQFQGHASLPRETIGALETQGFDIIKPFISYSVAMKKSHKLHSPIMKSNPRHKIAREYEELARGLMEGSYHTTR